MNFEIANPKRHNEDRRFQILLFVCLLVFCGVGLYLQSIKPAMETIEEKLVKIRTSFVVEEKQKTKPAQKKETKPKEKQTVKSEPLDLTNKPQVNQKVDDIPQEQPKADSKTVRRVYGLKRIYSKGIGAGGNQSDAIVGKLGNTLNTDIDTFTATKEELKGSIAPVTTLTSLPVLKKTVKPEYTKEMIENRVEGVIKAKLLIDIDGKVKKVILLNDLGFGSRDKALEALMQLEFAPAMRGDQPVAVWVPFSYRFELTDS